jgi:phosphoribosylaminoimidazolecarboxamide formyltransferase/IMP cyclohydrolase
MGKINRALISVSDKRGLQRFAERLSAMGVEIVSTGGTARLLTEAGLKVIPVSQVTGFPEIMEGRVKTLHPRIHGGILARRELQIDKEAMETHHIKPIDLVAVNLYPFEQTVGKGGVGMDEALEKIDIGGPCMIRAAAKNHPRVAVLCDPDDYESVMEELESSHGELSQETRLRLAIKAFQHTARYDSVIASFLPSLGGEEPLAFPHLLNLSFSKTQELRYGENPHQRASLYQEFPMPPGALLSAEQLHGKELSYNNIIDLDAALTGVREFQEPAAVIIKHTNPCGVATADQLAEAYIRARETDPDSAFGSVVGLNRTVDAGTAEELSSTFVEAVIAADFSPQALEILTRKKNIRLMKIKEDSPAPYLTPMQGLTFKKVGGGLLVQETDALPLDPSRLKVVTQREPTEEEMRALLFAWKVVKLVKSNAIVYTTGNRTVGIGAGQMSRVDSSRLAIMKARSPLEGTVLASDAFFPFRDGVDVAAEAGASAVIQPGGSVRDEEVIRAADEHGMAMVFTGIRHFRH